MFQGCDTDGMREVAARIDARSRRCVEIAEALGRSLTAVAWRGADAEAFRVDVRSRVLAPAVEVAARLDAVAESVRAEARAQDLTSAESAAGAGADGAVQTEPAASWMPRPDRSHAPDVVAIARDVGARMTPRGGGAAPMDRALPLDDGPSQGFFRDALGDTWGVRAETAWQHASGWGAKASMGIGPRNAITAIAVDAGNVRLGAYEASQGLRDGDVFAAFDGAAHTVFALGDGAANVLELTPLAPYGMVASALTGGVSREWNDLRGAALAEERAGGDSEGSPTRYLYGQLDDFNEDRIQPLAQSVGGPVGEAIGRAGTLTAVAGSVIIALHDVGRPARREAVREHPVLDEALATPRRVVEAPRHLLDRIRGRT